MVVVVFDPKQASGKPSLPSCGTETETAAAGDACIPPPALHEPPGTVAATATLRICTLAPVTGPALDAHVAAAAAVRLPPASFVCTVSLADLRAAVRRWPAYLREVDTGVDGWVAFDYDTWPPLATADGTAMAADSVACECRGIWVALDSGSVVSRPFHKFFETPADVSALPRDTLLLTKLDGTLVRPVLCPGPGVVWWASRRRVVDTVALGQLPLAYSAEHEETARAMVQAVLKDGYTPLFEWVTRGAPVGALTYDTDALVLTGVRCNATGAYAPDVFRALAAHVRCAPAVALDAFSRLATGAEGVVAVAPSGDRYKLKTTWYKDVVRLQQRVAHGTARLADAYLECRQGDASGMPLMWAVTAALAREEGWVLAACRGWSQQLTSWRAHARAAGMAPAAIECALTAAGWPSMLATATAPSASAVQAFAHTLGRAHSPRLLTLLAPPWQPCGGDTIDAAADTPYTALPRTKDADALVEHVCTTYARAKLGKFAVPGSEPPQWCVPHGYRASEGKLHGMHEKFASIAPDLRVDLQPVACGAEVGAGAGPGPEPGPGPGPADGRHHAPGTHFGTPHTALLLVQYGKHGSRPTDLAAIAVPVGVAVCVDTALAALRHSFSTHAPVHLTHANAAPALTVFVDLDGVLADFVSAAAAVLGSSWDTATPLTNAQWTALLQQPAFFERMLPMPGGTELWAAINRLCGEHNVAVLTGIPKFSRAVVVRDKTRWCARVLGCVPARVHACSSSDKVQYARPGALLVDDRPDVCRAWTAAGGLAVLHVSAARTLFELRRHLHLGSHGEACATTTTLAPTAPPPPFTPPTVFFHDTAWPASVLGAGVCALDMEWDPAAVAGAPAVSIAQLARSASEVHVLDVANSPAGALQVRDLLQRRDVVKVLFAGGQDLRRAGATVAHAVVDMEELFPPGTSLAQAASQLLREHWPPLAKEAHLQCGQWGVRPLPPDLLHYAAADAATLFAMWQAAAGAAPPATSVYCSPASAPVAATDDVTPGMQARVVYTCIALRGGDTTTVLAALAASSGLPHRPRGTLHVTLQHHPTAEQLPSPCDIGTAVSVTIDAVGCDGRFQVARVAAVEPAAVCSSLPRFLHVTLALASSVSAAGEGDDGTGSSAAAAAGKAAAAWPPHVWQVLPQALRLEGVFAAVVERVPNMLAALPPKAAVTVRQLCEHGIRGEAARFDACALTAAHRAAVHEYLETCAPHVVAEVTGRGDERRMTLRVRHKQQRQGGGKAPPASSSHHLVCSPETYARLDVGHGDQQGAFVGTVRRDGALHLWGDDDACSGDQPACETLAAAAKGEPGCRLVVLRGLPGTGKSVVARALPGATRFSADDEDAGGTGAVAAAHGRCVDLATQALRDGGGSTLVIDNTHATRAEYAPYLAAARDARVPACVVQLVGVPVAHQPGLVHVAARWQVDPQALLLHAWQGSPGGREEDAAVTLDRWLQAERLLHRSPRRASTHMRMAVGTAPAMFASIPNAHLPTFWRLYAAEVAAGRPLYWMETMPPAGQPFHMFFDIDGTSDVDQVVASIRRALSDAGVGSGDDACVVTGYAAAAAGDGEPLPGLHVHCPTVVMRTPAAALALARTVPHADLEVYSYGLRLPFSRKVRHGVDAGPCHVCLRGQDEEAEKKEEPCAVVRCLRACSIHDAQAQ